MKYISFFSALLFTACIQAQSPSGFSLVGGLNQALWQSDDLLAEGGLGFKGGIILNFGYHETYNYQIEVMYNQNTLNLLTVDQDYNRIGDTKFSQTGTEVGFYLNYYILPPEEDEFYIGPQAGGSFNFGTSLSPSGGTDTSNQYYLPYLLEENDLQDANKINYSAGLGVTGGYNNFRFDLRYNLGLSNTLKGVQTDSYNENNLYTGPTLDGKMSTLSFTISYRIVSIFGGE